MDEGSRTARVVIGLGAGSTELRIQAQVYQVTESGLLKVSVGEAKAYGAATPGIAVPVGVGAVAGRALTSLIVSGSMKVVTEARAGGNDADAERLAELIAERAQAFYQRHGWLGP